MEIQHIEEKKRFDLLSDDGTRMGEIEYMKGGNNELYATHTEVFPEYEGHGYAAKLLDAMAAWAEENGYTIVPVCPYVVRAFQKYPEKYAAVIKK